MQSLLMGLGAVLSSGLPFMLTNWFHVASTAGPNVIPRTVQVAFYIGSVVFLFAVLYTVTSTKEYPPEDLAAFQRMKKESAGLGKAVGEILTGIVAIPKAMRQLTIVQF